MNASPAPGEIFATLEIAVLERTGESFRWVTQPPAWIAPLLSPDRIVFSSEDLSSAFPLLETFLADAEGVWVGPGGRLDSETWLQAEPGGGELAFRSSAVRTAGRCFLLIQRLGAEFEERRAAIQTARSRGLAVEWLERRAAELADSNRDLQTRASEMARINQLKSEFLASMSHDLRTPLNAIIGFSSLLRQEKAGPLNEKQRGFVRQVRQAADHLLDLINDVLDLSKIEAGRMELHPSTFAMGDALLEVLPAVRALALPKNILVDTADTPPALTVHADRIRFKQILYNLLSNAVKFTHRNGKVSVAAHAEGAFLAMSVRDNGVGIPLDEQTAIFEKFYQGAAASGSVNEGTGLGLAITKRLVEQHGGEIRVESQPGFGSCFTFSVPLGVDPSRGEKAGLAPVEEDAWSLGQIATPKIAAVEDNPAGAMLLRAMLEPHCQVTLYSTGAEALDGMRRDRPDLVFLDISMPRMDGREVLARLREDPLLRPIPVVAISAHAMTGDRQRFLEAGFNAYIAKPIADASQLIAVIRRLLAR